MTPSSSTENSSSCTTSTESKENSSSNTESPFCSTDSSVSVISPILSDVRRCVRDSSVQYSVVGNSLYLSKGNVRSLRISYDDSSCKLWICSNGKETLDAEFALWDAGRIVSVYVDKYWFLE